MALLDTPRLELTVEPTEPPEDAAMRAMHAAAAAAALQPGGLSMFETLSGLLGGGGALEVNGTARRKKNPRPLKKPTAPEELEEPEEPEEKEAKLRKVGPSRGSYAPKDFKCTGGPTCKKGESCTKGFSTQKALGRHLAGTYKCEQCGQTFTSKAGYQNHIDGHAGKLECSQCNGQTFGSKQAYEAHLAGHAGGYTCDQCSHEPFVSKDGYEQHLAGHAGEYTCDECNHKPFMSKSGYNYHARWCGDEADGYKCAYDNCTVTMQVAARNPSLVQGETLCAMHSRIEFAKANLKWPGSPTAYYCTACAASDERTCASFEGAADEDGHREPFQLCARHAVEAGSRSSFKSGASHAACAALHVVHAQMQQQEPALQIGRHVHFEVGKDPEGCELTPLVHRPRAGVDGTLILLSEVKYLFQFHGNRFHGYQPGHPLYRAFGVGHQYNPVLFNRTMFRTHEYICGELDGGETPISDGVKLIEVWENDWQDYKRNPDVPLKFFVHEREPGMHAAVLAGLQVPEDGEPAGVHTSRLERENQGLPAGCELCRTTRKNALAAASTASATTSAPTAT